MKKDFLDFLSLSAGERKGIIVLVFIILLLAAVRLVTVFHRIPPASFNDSSFFRIVEAIEPGNPEAVETAGYYMPASADTFELFEFDPNKISAGDLLQLGLSEKVVRTWLNYRLHGGRFYEPGDISKIYGLSPEAAGRLIPYARIESGKNLKPSMRNEITSVITIEKKKDINSGDSVDLLKIQGIGPVLSGRIIKYRKLLGGYCRLDQLKEVYGLEDSLVAEVAKSFYTDTILIRKINVNSATEVLMRRHPYIGRHIAAGIAAYRKQVGTIQNLNELVINGILTREEFEKLKPYLNTLKP